MLKTIKFLGTKAFAGGYCGNNGEGCDIGKTVTIESERADYLINKMKGCWEVVSKCDKKEDSKNDKNKYDGKQNDAVGEAGQQSEENKINKEKDKKKDKKSLIKRFSR